MCSGSALPAESSSVASAGASRRSGPCEQVLRGPEAIPRPMTLHVGSDAAPPGGNAPVKKGDLPDGCDLRKSVKRFR
ncbi:hypothetical protein BRAS3809_2990001 [Bradyrhizobium sp. STM 3809]|nr:hypothetical protein BRAS3809_2990001 [Bradyrhizobium sp. STM 3809]